MWQWEIKTGRNLWQSQAHGRAAICLNRLGDVYACQTVLIDQQKKWEQIVLFRRVAGNKVPKDVI